jgi:CRISPR-associated exonuclease Cas4
MDAITYAIPVLGMVFLMALLMWARARRRILQSGIPDGRVVYQDTDRRRNVERPLVSRSCGLTGKPDYLVDAANGLVPVELKSRNCPRSGPHDGEVAQVTAYCVLVEESFGATPPHGIIQYADRSWPIRYSMRDRTRLLRILDEMRETRTSRMVHRDHQHAARCRACGYRAVCDEALD